MRRIAPLLLCLLLLFGGLCPAFCMQQGGAHACCHTHTQPCEHSGVTQTSRVNDAAILPAYVTPEASNPAEALVRNGRGGQFTVLSLNPPPPVLFRILRV
jgi:hypothetical protein